jgi:hypothetical protein
MQGILDNLVRWFRRRHHVEKPLATFEDDILPPFPVSKKRKNTRSESRKDTRMNSRKDDWREAENTLAAWQVIQILAMD